jgi:acetyltransferase-like isoleucine patch superfamily enzyme
MKMKIGIGRRLLKLSYYNWLFRCKYSYYVEGVDGLCRTISLLPKAHIVKVLKYYGAIIGLNCDIDTGLLLHRVRLPLTNLKLGNNVHIGHRSFFDLTKEIIFEDDSAVGSYSLFITHAGDWTHDRSDEHEKREKIHIGKSVIIYSGSIIVPGITIGSFSRIGAHSTVISNIPEYSFAVGSPAKVKKDRSYIYK